MAVTRLGLEGFLEYNAQYGLLICHTCRYAFQKSALASHLLRHKIYRGERHRLLSAIAKLNLLEPSRVPLPVSDCTPVATLPVLHGYRCTFEGCGHLCTSSKRMGAHWKELHSAVAISTNYSLRACEVQLQTFFRGTKTRYFEVSSLPGPVTAPVEHTTIEVAGDETRHEPSIPSLGPNMGADSEQGGSGVVDGTESNVY